MIRTSNPRTHKTRLLIDCSLVLLLLPPLPRDQAPGTDTRTEKKSPVEKSEEPPTRGGRRARPTPAFRPALCAAAASPTRAPASAANDPERASTYMHTHRQPPPHKQQQQQQPYSSRPNTLLLFLLRSCVLARAVVVLWRRRREGASQEREDGELASLFLFSPEPDRQQSARVKREARWGGGRSSARQGGLSPLPRLAALRPAPPPRKKSAAL